MIEHRFLRPIGRELHRPRAYDVGWVGERSFECGAIERADMVKCPERAEISDIVFSSGELTAEGGHCGVVDIPRGGALLENPARSAHVPFTSMRVEVRDLGVGLRAQVHRNGLV